MGRIANIQIACPHCGKTTNIYVEESGASSTNVKCEHCKKVFEFGPGMLYKPIGYVSAMPEGAGVKEGAREAVKMNFIRRWWRFWKRKVAEIIRRPWPT